MSAARWHNHSTRYSYKVSHDRIAAAVHCGLAKRYGLLRAEKWHDLKAEALSENEDVQLLWDFSIEMDKVIHSMSPYIVLVKKKGKECMIIDVAFPADCRTWNKEEEMIKRYTELA